MAIGQHIIARSKGMHSKQHGLANSRQTNVIQRKSIWASRDPRNDASNVIWNSRYFLRSPRDDSDSKEERYNDEVDDLLFDQEGGATNAEDDDNSLDNRSNDSMISYDKFDMPTDDEKAEVNKFSFGRSV